MVTSRERLLLAAARQAAWGCGRAVVAVGSEVGQPQSEGGGH